MNPKLTKEMTGFRSGRLVVVSYAGSTPDRHSTWNCICDCGKEFVSAGNAIRTGATKSCGCYRKSQSSKASKVHGATNTPEYGSWTAMRNRCNNPRAKEFRNYGGRGISICQRWNSFENFLADMGSRPKGTSIDRIDPDGNYSPENCRWATHEIQVNNRRNKKLVSSKFGVMTIAMTERAFGLRKGSIGYSINSKYKLLCTTLGVVPVQVAGGAK